MNRRRRGGNRGAAARHRCLLARGAHPAATGLLPRAEPEVLRGVQRARRSQRAHHAPHAGARTGPRGQTRRGRRRALPLRADRKRFTAEGVEAHARIVARDALYRRLITAAGQLVRRAYEGGADLDSVVATVESLLHEFAEGAQRVSVSTSMSWTGTRSGRRRRPRNGCSTPCCRAAAQSRCTARRSPGNRSSRSTWPPA